LERLGISETILVSTAQGLRRKSKDKSKGNQAFIAWVDRWNMLCTARQSASTSAPFECRVRAKVNAGQAGQGGKDDGFLEPTSEQHEGRLPRQAIVTWDMLF
jgi:hypothetical protein